MTGLHITAELKEAVLKVFTRFAKHGCALPWGDNDAEAAEMLFDTCAVLVDAKVKVEDIANAYGALMALECIRYRRFPSNSEILEAINSRRPDESETAIRAEASGIFGRIVKEVEGGRSRDLSTRVRDTFGLAASEALAACGGADRINSAGEQYIGAVWNDFQEAYCDAVAGGRDRGDQRKALPAPKPFLALSGATEAGPKRIGGSLADVLGIAEKPVRTVPVAAPVDEAARRAFLRKQAEELQAGERA